MSEVTEQSASSPEVSSAEPVREAQTQSAVAAVTDAAASGPASEAAAEPATAAAPAVPEAPAPRPKATLEALMESGAHFGHRTQRWNPKMKPFIFGEQGGIHIIDLDRTLPCIQAGLEFLRETVAQGGRVLFVATKRQARDAVREEAERAGQFFVNNRWLGGMLTNFRTVKRSIERFREQLEIVADAEQVAEFSKKELSRLNRSIGKYRKSLDGLKEMQKLPDAMFVIDINKEHIAVSEARRLEIPIVAVVDTNCSPEGIDFPIPANDDAIRAVRLYCALAADACLEGAELFNARVTSEQSAEEEGVRTLPTGRRVVEIQQPRGDGGGRRERSRRGGDRRKRQAGGSFSAGGRSSDDDRASPPPAATTPTPPPPATPVKDAPASDVPAAEKTS